MGDRGGIPVLHGKVEKKNEYDDDGHETSVYHRKLPVIMSPFSGVSCLSRLFLTVDLHELQHPPQIMSSTHHIHYISLNYSNPTCSTECRWG
jgi:hypothetical protein